ncbi:MAG TPA: hypothetical protein VHX86_18770 [Tepidisphaeraceae bacterium]|jgi:uncharacterized integral membrane protein|nr:hypothetical protein [Tepidisphaeraceae bacterium]
MQNLWLKIKIWTKITIFSVLVIYLLIFVFQNANKELVIWWWFGKNLNTSALELIPAMLLAGVLGTLVVRMAFRAVKQIRDLRRRSADAQLHKDMAEIKAKAAMLQTKPEGTGDQGNPV